MKHLLLLIFVLFSLQAKESIEITDANRSFYDFTIQAYDNENAELSFETLEQTSYKKTNNHLSEGYNTNSFWYRFDVTNHTDKSTIHYLQFSEIFLHQVDFYLDDGKKVEHIREGIATLEQSKEKTHKPTFKIELQPNQTKTVTLNVLSKYPIFASFYLVTEQELFTHTHEYDLFYTFFIAAIFSLILYNISIFVFTKDRPYLYYVLYASTFLTWQLIQTGFQPFNSFTNIENFYRITLSIPLMLMFLVLFTQSLLDVKKSFPVINTILNACIAIFVGSFVIGFFNFTLAMTIVNGLAFVLLPFLLFVGVKSYLVHNKTALFYIVAQFSFLTTATLFALGAFGLYDFTQFTRHAIIVGLFIEIVLFSFALAYRIKLLEQQKLELTQRDNRILDKLVKERTKELEESRERLNKLANSDSMTNLYNRRSLFDISKKLIALAKREKTPLSIVMFDLDHFKSINDGYGHKMGDSVIINFAWILKRLRGSDVIARIGGEEFIALLPNTSLEDAFKIGETIRKECEKTSVKINDTTSIGFTVSGGVATLREEDNTIEELIYRADKRLYKAKNLGRNRVIMKD